jgi:hypothetical protein
MKLDLYDPKSKAEELLSKMTTISSKLSDYSMIYSPTARLHALIAVEEFLKYCDSDEKHIVMGRYMTMKEYWKEVMKELENL